MPNRHCLNNDLKTYEFECYFKTIQHRLAEVKTEASVGRAFCDSAMRLFMEGMVFEILICLLIIF